MPGCIHGSPVFKLWNPEWCHVSQKRVLRCLLCNYFPLVYLSGRLQLTWRYKAKLLVNSPHGSVWACWPSLQQSQPQPACLTALAVQHHILLRAQGIPSAPFHSQYQYHCFPVSKTFQSCLELVVSCPVLKMDVWMFVLLLVLIQVNALKLKQPESGSQAFCIRIFLPFFLQCLCGSLLTQHQTFNCKAYWKHSLTCSCVDWSGGY